MKKLFVSSLLLFFSLNLLCQSTTETEYLYMKKGYRQIAESGMDLKKGYTTQELKKYESGKVTVTFTLLKRENGSLAGTILKTISNEDFGSGTNYYVVPAPADASGITYGWDLFFADLNNMTCGMRMHVLQWLTANFSQQASEYVANHKSQ